jgi:hypothetical protein
MILHLLSHKLKIYRSPNRRPLDEILMSLTLNWPMMGQIMVDINELRVNYGINLDKIMLKNDNLMSSSHQTDSKTEVRIRRKF